ncbi:MAG: preprotein translocase subunit SecY [Oscillospiraceae bacterium]|nr:preprotein translocase subunit SecY [Oscillospiraceae bacterium]
MFQTIRNAWKIPDVRKKVFYTLFIIFIFRLGSAVPVPFLDAAVLRASVKAASDALANGGGNILNYFNTLTGGAFENATLFAMGVTPYINSSIIIQLLTVAIPPLEKLAKEGEEGRKKLAQITRYTTVILGLIQGTAYFFYLKYNHVSMPDGSSKVATIWNNGGFNEWFAAFVIVLTFTAGTALMMWLGEQINQRGIGNGISMLLFAGIVSRGPDGFKSLYTMVEAGLQGGANTKYIFFAIAIPIIFLAIIGFIVFMDNAERRIPVQYAKRMVGRKMYGGQSTHIPIKVNMSGVMPIIFASSIITIPQTVRQFVYPNGGKGFWYSFWNAFRYDGWLYPTLFFVLIILFAYFYVTIQYNPIEMANNLRKNSGVIPGIRPGRPTTEFISKIIRRITLIGALFLSVIALLPIAFGSITKTALGIGGTSILILVGVALETVRQLESQMLMRHYKGFLD